MDYLEILKIVLPIVFGFFSGYYIQKLRNRPQIITHRCRISNEDVYAYFGSNNKPSSPACPFLMEGETCMLPTDKTINKWVRDLHKGKCYFALLGKEKK